MTDTLNLRLAARLSGLRAARGWTLDRLAAESGVSRAALSRVENGEVSPSAEVLARIARAHGMGLARLLAPVDDGAAARVPADAQPVTSDSRTGACHRVLSPADPAFGARIVQTTLPAGAEMTLDAPLAGGCLQHLWLQSGALQVDVEGQVHRLTEGDVLRMHLFASATLRAGGTEEDTGRTDDRKDGEPKGRDIGQAGSVAARFISVTLPG